MKCVMAGNITTIATITTDGPQIPTLVLHGRLILGYAPKWHMLRNTER